MKMTFSLSGEEPHATPTPVAVNWGFQETKEDLQQEVISIFLTST